MELGEKEGNEMCVEVNIKEGRMFRRTIRKKARKESEEERGKSREMVGDIITKVRMDQ